MQIARDGRFVRTDIWREGEYLDLWSVPHFLSGMAVALGLYLIGFATNAAFIIALLLLVAYEMFEVIAKIEETRWNRILDVVVGMVSFTPTFLFAPLFAYEYIIATFIVVLIADVVLSYFGWRASQKAVVLETKFRAEFEKERERFAVRRARFSERLHRRQVERLRARVKRKEHQGGTVEME